ncbi:MarR family winged helix-turn-helix transcriptional regulator [Chryseobacterium sp. PMSZPI]|uniref:MarR family winged helix-turn-helix transcriptional regulator n=1 Tax=Chryseobacterium sp. PMSZPI TaxID=1033900 RepID=UPI000C34379A|nr:MarR family transcriptional regulator [Chryseobacterium sp. PMSZPI]PKF76125.1 MarR family transcriptional regulator [Chryseobacterium sp. PMSZPI]
MMDLSEHLCFKMYAFSRYMTALYKPYLDEISLTYPQYLVMVVLWENDAVSIGKIGEQLHLDNGTLTPLLKRMEKNGLLSRTRSNKDERIVLITLTEKGKSLKSKTQHIPEEVQKCIHINRDTKAQLMKIFDEMVLNQPQIQR